MDRDGAVNEVSATMAEPTKQPDQVAPASTSSSTTQEDGIEVTELNEEHIEYLLGERLKLGYTLMESSCPACETPLVRMDEAVHNAVQKEKQEREQQRQEAALEEDGTGKFPMVVPSQSFEQPFAPVVGVPFCVHCVAHVVTGEKDIDALERCDSLKNKGSILVAVQDTEDDEDDDDEEEEEEE